MPVADTTAQVDAATAEHAAEERPAERDDHDVQRPRRRCSRCRGEFECEPGLDARVLRGWWLCDPCQAALIGPNANVAPAVAAPRHDEGGEPC